MQSSSEAYKSQEKNYRVFYEELKGNLSYSDFKLKIEDASRIITKELPDSDIDYSKLCNEEFYNLLLNVAKKSSYEEFSGLVRSNEIPAIKLSDAEMELLRGGWKNWLGGAVVVLASAGGIAAGGVGGLMCVGALLYNFG